MGPGRRFDNGMGKAKSLLIVGPERFFHDNFVFSVEAENGRNRTKDLLGHESHVSVYVAQNCGLEEVGTWNNTKTDALV